MSETKTTGKNRWLIWSFSLPCLVVGLAAAGICIWDMWGQDIGEVAIAAFQNFFWLGLLSGIVGIPVGYVLNQIRSRGFWG